jgi:hypothetical protein
MRLTHWQFLQSVKHLLSSPCTSLDLTFGGRCLNCGHDPNRVYQITFVVEGKS